MSGHEEDYLASLPADARKRFADELAAIRAALRNGGRRADHLSDADLLAALRAIGGEPSPNQLPFDEALERLADSLPAL